MLGRRKEDVARRADAMHRGDGPSTQWVDEVDRILGRPDHDSSTSLELTWDHLRNIGIMFSHPPLPQNSAGNE